MTWLLVVGAPVVGGLIAYAIWRLPDWIDRLRARKLTETRMAEVLETAKREEAEVKDPERELTEKGVADALARVRAAGRRPYE